MNDECMKACKCLEVGVTYFTPALHRGIKIIKKVQLAPRAGCCAGCCAVCGLPIRTPATSTSIERAREEGKGENGDRERAPSINYLYSNVHMPHGINCQL